MSRFFSKELSALVPYVPGEQPKDQKYIKLNTNESPFPPSPKVISALDSAQVGMLNLYSDPTASELVNAIAEVFGVERDEIAVGNGSDEILAFAFHAFSDKGFTFPSVTYGFYPVFADFFGAKYNTLPLNDDLSINVEDYKNLDTGIVIANPNAQTGIYLEPWQIEEIVASNPDNIVIIDEAYIDFGGESVYPLTRKYDNLLVVGTFSKSRNLAGARVGFAIGCKALIADINTMKFSFNPYNLNRLSIVAAKEAVLDTQYFDTCMEKVKAAREFTKNELEKLGFYCTPSLANFILAQSDKIAGKELYLELKSRGILVRYLGIKEIENYVRITIGSKDQMQMMIDAIKEILKQR